MRDDFVFADREDAALLLSKRLEKYRGSDALVLAVPRGGVPIGTIVAQQLGLPLDVVLVKKLGHPANPEYAIGSVSLRGVRIDRPSADVSEDYLKQESTRIRLELERRRRLFSGNEAVHPVKDRTVILVDDGIATGSTLLAAVADLREAGAYKLIVAVPVAPPGASHIFKQVCDEYIVLQEPRNFSGVGQFYAEFDQVTDGEVASLLNSFRNTVKNKP